MHSSLDLADLPIFCAHEHWGSIDAIGTVPEGFRADVECGATPRRRTGLLDVVLDPYFGGWLSAAGVRPDDLARTAGAETMRELAAADPARAMELLAPTIRAHALTGVWQCLRRGIAALHGADIARDEAARADRSIAEAYAGIFTWYPRAMTTARFSALIRPVHPLYYMRAESPKTAAAERAFTHTVMRIDPLLGLAGGPSETLVALSEATGVEPGDAGSWRRFLAALFELAATRGCVGIKQLQAYSRSLDFAPVADGEVVWRGERTPDEQRAFQDWLVHACCALADDRAWPHQVHVGTHNLPHSIPLPLAPLAERYRRMTIVQLHCWPFLDEAALLARSHPNVLIDTCWMPILNPAFLHEALDRWLGYLPASKIMMSQDATSVEMATGSAEFVREILSEALNERAHGYGLSPTELRSIAVNMLHNNAVAVYRIGDAYAV